MVNRLLILTSLLAIECTILFAGRAIAQQKEGSVSTVEKKKVENAPSSEQLEPAQTPVAEPQKPTETLQDRSGEAPQSTASTTTEAAPPSKQAASTPAAAPPQTSSETVEKETTPETAPTSTPATPPLSAETQSKACLPKCRSGYLCHDGSCVSACNPPCSPNQSCSAQGECVDSYPGHYGLEDVAMELKPIDPRHTGLFLHFSFGLGYASLYRNKGDKVEMYGGSTHYTADIGWAFIENLIVHARLGFDDATNPVVEYKDREYVDIRRSYLFTWKTLIAATYYIMPINIFGTLAVGIEKMDIKLDDLRLDDKLLTKGSDVGFSLEVDIGKEWWADEEWGVGVSGRFNYANLSPDDTGSMSDRLHVITTGLMLSISYN